MNNNYYDYAEADYNMILKAYEANAYGNLTGSSSQNICEKFMKHLIDLYYNPETPDEERIKEDSLRTHSLRKLSKFLKQNLDFSFSDKTQHLLMEIDGYYFTARYPGDNSIELDDDDINDCIECIKLCKNEVDAFIKENELNNDFSEQLEQDDDYNYEELENSSESPEL